MTATCPKCGYEWQTRSKLDRPFFDLGATESSARHIDNPEGFGYIVLHMPAYRW